VNNSIKVLILMGCMAPSAVYSAVGDTWLQVHGFSRHIGYDGYYAPVTTQEFNVVTQESYTKVTQVQQPFNEFNPGIGFGYEFVDGIEARAGFYYNSFSSTSLYGGLNWHTSHDRLLSAGLMVGIVGGYNESFTGAGNEITLAAQPTLAVNITDYRMEFGYIPGLKDHQSDIITLSFGIRY
jgi:hypothetical protein